MDGEWLDDAFGPDAVRVTFCFTTAVSRYAQALSGICAFCSGGVRPQNPSS
ncbi:MAG TPA: hypothetical protein VK662_09505 [Acidothermaceae bacterium]|jgi:hypothetical protein|nr:hypothetical protein [Acidothermaceae bacterium]